MSEKSHAEIHESTHDAAPDKEYERHIDWSMLLYIGIITVVLYIVKLILLGGIAFALPIRAKVIVGLIVFALGYGLSVLEKYNGQSLFYAYGNNWNGGYFNNSGMILAVGITLMSPDIIQTIIWYVIVCAAQLLLRYYMSVKREQKAHHLLNTAGVADTEITYKGRAEFAGKQYKTQVLNRGDEIPKGSAVKVAAFDGFKPMVVKTEK